MKKKDSNDLNSKISKVLITYFKTQFLLILIVSLVIWGILTSLNVPFSLLLAILTGVFSTIPLFGLLVMAFVVSLVAIFDKVVFLTGFHPIFEGLVVLVIYILLNQLIDWVLSPYLISKTTKINPFLLIFSVLLGTVSFGLLGAFLSVPIVLVLKTIWEYKRDN